MNRATLFFCLAALGAGSVFVYGLVDTVYGFSHSQFDAAQSVRQFSAGNAGRLGAGK